MSRASGWLRAGLLASSFGVLAVAGAASVAAQATPGSSFGGCVDSEEARFLDRLNAYRTENGLPPLALSLTLSEAADLHSSDMAARGYFDHTMADGTTVEQNLRNFGYTDSTYGENILAGSEGADDAFATWQASPGHDANMRRSAFRAIGIARVYDVASPYGWYWTTLFGGSLDEPGVVCGGSPAGGRSAIVNDPDVNLRSGPGRDNPVLAVLDEGDAVSVTGDADNGYLPVEAGGVLGWVATEWLDVQPDASATVAQPAAQTTVTETVNLREAPSRESGVAAIVPGGSAIEPTGRTQDGYVEASWDGTTGWIDGQYVAGSDAGLAAAAQPAAGAASATTTDDVNVRAQPDPAAAVMRVVPAGTIVQLTGERVAGYFGVTVDGAQGWIDAAYLR